METIFTEMYHRNKAALPGSVSGPGSDLDPTQVIRNLLPRLFRELKLSSMLDIPCGDFNWMRFVDLAGMKYIGADIIAELVESNRVDYALENITFEHLNLIQDDLPEVDLILCRDCLVHFSFDDIFKALHNIVRSESDYLLATHFTERDENHDIPTGSWRTLNLEISPFNLPQPLRTLNEGYTGNQGRFRDKSLALWTVDVIRQTLAR
jgi:SAM-dependent methyltransferase